ncbi:MAG: DUF2752 domain-containing protein [Clostridia bacterium]|nr:DUF2752 domain-containing protein [Clostridia bacterium]
MAQRFKKVALGFLILIAVGIIYALFVIVTQKSIPCVFNLITGLKCPGCGVTRMCVSIIKLDFYAAFRANPAIFCLLPLMALTAGRMIYVYVKYNRRRERLTQISMYFMVAVLVVFGVLRNII